MRLTGRGRSAVLSILVINAFALVFLDLLLLVPGVALLGVFCYDLIMVRRTAGRLSELVEVAPSEVEDELTAGESHSSEVTVVNDSAHSIKLRCRMEDAELFMIDAIEGGSERVVDYSFHSELSGEYESDGIVGEVKGSFGLWTDDGEVPLEQSFEVRPRVLGAAIRAARFLEAAGRSGFGDQPTDIKGTGLEYSGSREYQPGDEIKHMDWKATARLNRPIVKEYYLEGGLGVHLVHEVGAPDPVSFDRLSTSFINTALALAQRTIPFGLTVFEGEKVHLHVRRVEPRLGLAMAMEQALETAEVGVEDLYQVLEPRTSREVRQIVRRVDSGAVKSALSSERTEAEPYKRLEETIRNSGGRLHLVFNSSLAEDVRPVLELDDFAGMKNCELMVLQPTTPWRNAEELEERYGIRERYGRTHGILKRRGIPVSGSVESLIERISSERLAVQREI